MNKLHNRNISTNPLYLLTITILITKYCISYSCLQKKSRRRRKSSHEDILRTPSWGHHVLWRHILKPAWHLSPGPSMWQDTFDNIWCISVLPYKWIYSQFILNLYSGLPQALLICYTRFETLILIWDPYPSSGFKL